MKTKLITVTAILLILAGGLTSCIDHLMDELLSNTTVTNEISLKGTSWKLVGIVDAETGDLTELEPKNCEECFTLTFETDHIATVRSINKNTLKLDLLNLTPDAMMDDRLWLESDENGQTYNTGDLFRRAIILTESYEVSSEELKFYGKGLSPRSGGDYYLLFKPFKTSEQ